MTQLGTQPELSLVIPVFDGSASIARVAETILREYRDLEFEIILVNDGSSDDSELVRSELSDRH